MDCRMQADGSVNASRPTLRIGERHTSGAGRGEEEIAKAILPIDICSHRRFTGVVLYSGEHVLRFGEGFYAVPFSALGI